jgi:uncharacterized repeat protein (TIGR01451 family)
MSKIIERLLIAALLLTAVALRLEAQRTPGRALQISAENLSAQSPRHAVLAAKSGDSARVLPGDTLRYRLLFTNVSTGPVHGIVLDNPIPAGLRYQPGSAKVDRPDVAILFSIDGGATYSASPMVDVDVDGKREQRPAPAERYTHVRWTVRGDVPKGAQIHAEYDVQAK